MANVDVEEYEGWKITLDSETGRFTGKRRERDRTTSLLTRKSLSDLKREIGKRSSSKLDLMSLSDIVVEQYDRHPSAEGLNWRVPDRLLLQKERVTIVGIEGDRPRREDGILDHWRPYAPYDEAFLKGVEAYMERRVQLLRALNEKFDAWVKEQGISKMTAEQAKKLLQEARQAFPAAEEEATIEPE